ncbi:MAG: hypothetical protein R2873_09880 [Caldilineaceae bacterium]
MKKDNQRRFFALAFEIIGALLVGFFAAAVVGNGLSVILVGSALGDQLGMGVLTIQIYGAILAFGIGAGIGAGFGGRLLRQNGSVWFAMSTSLMFSALVVLISRTLMTSNSLVPTLFVALGVSVVGAVIGYNRRRSSPT